MSYFNYKMLWTLYNFLWPVAVFFYHHIHDKNNKNIKIWNEVGVNPQYSLSIFILLYNYFGEYKFGYRMR
jgi:hypothetical protein